VNNEITKNQITNLK